jgi:hypothetical protein
MYFPQNLIRISIIIYMHDLSHDFLKLQNKTTSFFLLVEKRDQEYPRSATYFRFCIMYVVDGCVLSRHLLYEE